MSFARPRGPFCVPTKGAPTLSAPKPRPIVFAVGERIARTDIPRLCDALGELLDVGDVGDAGVVLCDVGALVRPDAVTVEALARLQLTAVRAGRRIRLCNVSDELWELIDFMGLRAPMSSVSPRGVTA
jgi:ABC-type transporter Mla MlaB component